jgi:hypothetical protein
MLKAESMAARADRVERVSCDTRATCRAAILVARALARERRSSDARALLTRIRASAVDFGAGARWEHAMNEVTAGTPRSIP